MLLTKEQISEQMCKHAQKKNGLHDSFTFLRLVRVSRTKEALQLRSLIMGKDFVSWAI